MALSVTSSLVSAPNVARVKGYNLKLSSAVNAETINVNSSAQELYNKIMTNYNNIKNYFDRIGDEFIAAKKNVVGDKVKENLQRLGRNCKNQGQYCLNRRSELSNLFEYASLEKRIADLEAALSSVE